MRSLTESDKLPRMKNTVRVLAGVVVCACVASSCNRTPPELQAVVDAADAMGGRQKIAAVKTLTIEGEGDAPNVGQNQTPDGELPNWKVTEFKRTIDLNTTGCVFSNCGRHSFSLRIPILSGRDKGSTATSRSTSATTAKPRERLSRRCATAGLRCSITRSSSCVRRSTVRERNSREFGSAGNQTVVEIETEQGRARHARHRFVHKAAVAHDVDELQREPG